MPGRVAKRPYSLDPNQMRPLDRHNAFKERQRLTGKSAFMEAYKIECSVRGEEDDKALTKIYALLDDSLFPQP